jgi:hypothetical protein
VITRNETNLSFCGSTVVSEMVDSKIEDRAIKLSREAVELIDAGHKEVRMPQTCNRYLLKRVESGY